MYALKMNIFSITSPFRTKRWPWDVARANLRPQSKANKEQVKLLTGVVSGAAVCTTHREKNAGGKHGTDKVGDL